MTVDGVDYTATNNGDGTWTLADDVVATLADGVTTVDVTATDAAGNEGTGSGSVTVDATAPAAPSVELTNDTGSSATDLITSDGTLTVTPNEAGNTIEYSTDGGTTWSTTPPTATEGSNTVTVREIDTAGNPSATASITFTLDTTAPTITLDEISDNYINALESGEDLIISGTTDAEDGQNVVVNFNGTDYTATVTAGVFSVTVPAVDVATLSNGTTYTATATVSDVAGNTANDTEDVTVDTTPPAVTEELPEDSINDTGASDSDNITYNGTPTLSGTTEPDSEVTVTIPNAPFGDLVYTTTADSSGNWSISIDSQLVDGAHTPTITATDPAGNTTTITGETFTVDTNEPVINIDTTLEGDNVINASEQADVTISGTIGDGNSWTNIEDGQIVTVTLSDGVTTLTTTATVSGNTWTATDVDVSSLTDGNITVTADVTDVAGNTAVTATTTLVKDTAAPNMDQLKITNIVDNTGDYSSVTMYGTGAEVGNTIAIYDEDDNLVATATVQSDGTWSVDISNLSNTPVGDNEFFSVTETDAAGNTTGQTDSTHYYHGDGSSISTESTDDYVLTGDGNDTIDTDQAVITSGNEDDVNDYVMIDGGNGTDTVNFGGNVSDYTITTDVNGNIIVTETATSDSNGDGTGDVTELRNIETIVFADGTYNVTTSNFIPTSTDDSITILEDMNNTTDVYTLTTNDFGTYSDVEGDSLAFIRIDSLPTNGTLYLDGIAVTAGTVIEVPDIDSGLLTFNPTDNSDADSSFTFSMYDGTDWSATSYTTAINITAVADTPTLAVDGAQSSGGDDLIDLVTIPSGTGLTQQIYDNVSSVFIDSANLESTVEGLTPDSETIVTQPYSTGSTDTAADDIVAGTIEVTTGLIYLEAGTTISFSGYFDDSLQIELGGTTLISTTGDAYGTYDTSIVGTTTTGQGTAITAGTYTVSESGYYTLDIYTYNHGGPGDLSINVSVDGATPVALDTTNFNLYSGSADIGGQHSSLVSTDGENGYYPIALNVGVEGSPIKLTSISAALTDTDGSETLSITISDIPEGCTISDGTNTFTATSGATTVDVTNWDLDSLTYTASDVSSSGSINELTVTATATEGANGDTASVSETITVTINTAPVAVADQAVINMPDSTTTAYYVTSNEEIGTVDLTTGVQTVIGTPGYTHGTIYDIAATSNGALYAITSSDRLYSIDTSTAAATSIGNVRTSSNQDVGTIVGLAFSADDTLYGMTNNGHLYSINTSTGVATSVTNTDFGGTCDDLVYYDDGLYILADNNLLRYDLTTGSVSTIVTGMGGTLYGLALNDDGNIYVIKNDGTAYIVDPTNNTYTSANNIDLSGTIYGAASTAMTATTVTITGDVTPETTGQDHDADGDSFSVTGVLAGSTMSASGSVGAEIQGTYGTLVMQADGSYTYTLDKSLTAGAKNAYEEATDRVFYYVDNGGNIGTVDPETGATIVIGYSGHAFYDIAITPSDTLYGIMGNGAFYNINTSTATSTYIGTANVSGEIRGLVSDSDGTLYALTYSGNLYTIDATTGTATQVGSLGSYYCDDILYYDGDIYALSNGNLLKYDLDTGTVTTVVTGMPYNMYGIGIDSDGSIYAFQYYGSIYAIDLDAGTATDTGVDVDDYVYGVSSAFNDLSATAFYATDTFTYTITDEDGMTSTTTLTINVTDPDTTSITGSVTDTVLTGDSDSNIIISNNSDGAELYGGDGNDILIGMEGVADSLYGGDGNDILVYDASDVVIDGGNGSDVLIFNTDTTLDFGTLNSSTNPITNIETLDLTDASVALDHLGAADVLDITGNSDTTLKILGDSDDTVNLDGWAASGQTNQDGITYNVYTDTSGTSTQIWVQADVGHIVL